ncbi:MAG: Quorum-sensing regulator protein [Bacteroidota bacterium]|jgi:transcriptional regulator with PAS, ATPase and Fis domain
MELQVIKNRFGIIGNSPLLNRAIDIATQVAPTDISVLITGESGSGKEVFSQIIHQLSARKHGPFIAVNCGAIPEGTIDSELFGHEKGSFTGAHEARKGYFEVVSGGTIFLDEVAELPIGTQARLLRVLETGEYLRVGSSKVQKTNVRIVAATNVNVYEAVQRGKFREDLYYRLNTVPLKVPSLRERKEDVYLLFRKFISDFSVKYRSPNIQLNEEARAILENYTWPGNIRQLKNVAEQISVLQNGQQEIDAQELIKYLPFEQPMSGLPARLGQHSENDFSERDILYKVLFDMKKDLTDLKKVVLDLLQNSGTANEFIADNTNIINKLVQEINPANIDMAGFQMPMQVNPVSQPSSNFQPNNFHASPYKLESPIEEVEETLSLEDKEIDYIKKALKKHKGKRKLAAQELGISERTLYRKIKEYDINL